MPDGQTGQELSPRRQFEIQLDEQAQNFRALLPNHIPVEKFKRVVVVAVSQNPDLFHADRRSFFNAAQKCAVDGLLPDGRQAALVVYNTKTKVRLPDGTSEERWVPAVQYMPMIAGVRQRMRNSGEVLSAEAHVVYRNDKFFQKFGDDPAIVHEPPPFGTERGDPVGAYAIIKLKNGEVLREVMDKQQIERVRAISKSKDGPAWKGWWDEMARKTVMRRCAKAAPNSADVDTLLDRDEERPELQSLVELPGTEPEPQRQISDNRNDLADSYIVIDADGEEREFETAAATGRALRAVFGDAKRRGRPAWEAASENNASTLAAIRDNAPDEWRELQNDLYPFGPPTIRATETSEPPAGAHSAKEDARLSGDPPAGEPDPGHSRDDGRAWLTRVNELAPQPVDLASDEPDWPRYATAMVELIAQATAADLAAMQVSKMPHMQRMRIGDGDSYQRVQQAIGARAKEVAGG